MVVLLDFIGTERPLKLGDLCWLPLSLAILPLLSTSLLIEGAMDSFFLHGEQLSEFISTFPTVLIFGELVDLALALADSVAAMYAGVEGELENEGSSPTEHCLL